MKLMITILIQSICLVLLPGLQAQNGSAYDKIDQYQSNKSVQFGFDTYINNQPLEDQKNIVICSAFNGWLFAVYSYFDKSVHEAAATVLRSKDNGVTWSIIFDETIGWAHTVFTKMDIITAGQDTANLKFFLGYCLFDSISTYHNGYVTRYNGNTGIPEGEFLDENSHEIRDLELATDGLYPAANSNPFSIGVVYSKKGYAVDSIIFRSSDNGGLTFNKRYSIAFTSHYFNKVDLAYGRSATFPDGRYFAVWEEKESLNSTSGHIYTAHSESYFNSMFTTPVLIDNLDPSSNNKASNPVIACQSSWANNDSSNFTEVVLFEKFRPGTNDYNIAGVYSKVATGTNNFHAFNVNASPNNILQPNICFNPYDSSFITTCYDSTAQKLPYLIHDFQMSNPDSWTVLSSGYNDNTNLVAPYPKVAVNFGIHSCVNTWISKNPGGNGAAMFDAPYLFYTSVPGINGSADIKSLKIFPNPASDYSVIEFELSNTEDVELVIANAIGQPLVRKSFPSYTVGKHRIKIDLSDYPSGIYILKIYTGSSFFSDKIIVTW